MSTIIITPEMKDDVADVCGVLSFTYEMQEKLDEKRKSKQFKYSGWHKPDGPDTNESLTNWAKKCIDEGRFVDAANLLMMVHNRKKMGLQ